MRLTFSKYNIGVHNFSYRYRAVSRSLELNILTKLLRCTITALLLLVIVTSAYSQKPGNLQFKLRDGKFHELSLSRNVMIMRFNCDSLFLNTGSLTNVSTITINPCKTDSSTSVESQTQQNPEQMDFVIYPNPTNGYITLSINAVVGDVITVQIFNILGELIQQLKPFTTSAIQNQIGFEIINTNGSTMTSGIYFIRATSQSGTATKSIVIY